MKEGSFFPIDKCADLLVLNTIPQHNISIFSDHTHLFTWKQNYFWIENASHFAKTFCLIFTWEKIVTREKMKKKSMKFTIHWLIRFNCSLANYQIYNFTCLLEVHVSWLYLYLLVSDPKYPLYLDCLGQVRIPLDTELEYCNNSIEKFCTHLKLRADEQFYDSFNKKQAETKIQ